MVDAPSQNRSSLHSIRNSSVPNVIEVPINGLTAVPVFSRYMTDKPELVSFEANQAKTFQSSLQAHFSVSDFAVIQVWPEQDFVLPTEKVQNYIAG